MYFNLELKYFSKEICNDEINNLRITLLCFNLHNIVAFLVLM